MVVESMYCNNCGNRLENSNNFCNKCGKKIIKENYIKNKDDIGLSVLAYILLLANAFVTPFFWVVTLFTGVEGNSTGHNVSQVIPSINKIIFIFLPLILIILYNIFFFLFKPNKKALLISSLLSPFIFFIIDIILSFIFDENGYVFSFYYLFGNIIIIFSSYFIINLVKKK